MPRDPSRVTAYKTAVFRIHKPSRTKRAMLNDALTRNHRAYSKLLSAFLPRLDEFAKHRAGKKREAEIYKIAAPLVGPLPLSIGAKAGVVSDVAGQLSSYIELRNVQDSASQPTAARLNATQADYIASLAGFAAASTLELENSARDRLMAEARAGLRRPILFLKNRRADGYVILYSPEKRDYYIWLNLHSKTSRFAREIGVKELVDVRTGEVVSFKSQTGALFPVECGRDFHLGRFMERARPQSAKLIERGGRYEVHVTFEFENPKIEPECFIGVDRGIYNLASLAVVDDSGTLIAERNLEGRTLRHVQRIEERRQRTLQKRGRRYSSRSRRAMADEAIHVTANAIVELALRHRGQVVLEYLGQLTNRSGKRGRSNFNRVLNRSQYQKLQSALDYKLSVVGLPKAKTVSAAYTSQTCPNCGHQDRENRPKLPDGDGFKVDKFICQHCGHAADADLNAARVIALKRMWRDSLPQSQRPKPMSELAENYSFKSYLRDRAVMREKGLGGRMVGTSGGPGLEHGRTTPLRETGG